MTRRTYHQMAIPPVIRKSYEDTLSKLAALELPQGLKFKPFGGATVNGHKVYYVRDNQKHRLFFIHIPRDGKIVLNFLAEDLKHKQKRLWFYNKNVEVDESKLWLNKDMIDLSDSDNLPDSGSTIIVDDTATTSMPGHLYSHVVYYQEQLICLDDQQEQVFVNASWPLIISGPPGSGKSCVEIGLLESWVKAAKEEYLLTFPMAVPQSSSSTQIAASSDELMVTHFAMPSFAYVAESIKLREHMAEIWRAQPDLIDVTDCVRFNNYEQILKHAIPELENKRFLTKTESHSRFLEEKSIRTLLKKLMPVQPKAGRGRGKGALSTASMDLEESLLEKLYQEFLMLSGYAYDEHGKLEFELYKNLGVLTSRFAHETEVNKLAIFNAFLVYQQGLASDKANIVDPYLYHPKEPLPQLFSGMAVDEAQDYVPVQTWVFKQLTEGARVAFGVDTHQNIGAAAQNSIRMFMKHKLDATNITLNYPYRYPNHVMDVLNEVLHLKLTVSQGIADKDDYHDITRSQEARDICQSGHVSYTARLPVGKELEELKSSIQGRDSVAIITRPELVESLRKLLGHALVFSPEQIKGLEFETIIVWDLLSAPNYYGVNKRLLAQGATQSHQYRAKDKTADVDVKSVEAMAALLTAISRSTHTLHIYQKEDAHRLGCITEPLKAKIASFTATKQDAAASSTPATREAWDNLVNKLIKEGAIEQAQAVWVQELKQNMPAFETRRRQVLGLPTPMVGPSSSSSSARSNRGRGKGRANKPRVPQKTQTQHLLNPTLVQIEQFAADISAGNESRVRNFAERYRLDFKFKDRTPLLMAVYSNRISMVRLLLQYCDINQPGDADKATPLMIATKQRQFDIVKLLIENNAKLESKDKDGATALAYSVIFGSSEIVQHLLEAGADVTIINHNSLNVLEMVIKCNLRASHNQSDILTRFIRADLNSFSAKFLAITKLLIKHNAPIGKALLESKAGKLKDFVDLLQKYANQCLYKAVVTKNLTMVKKLLNEGANPNLLMANNRMLLLAIQKGSLEIIEALLEAGADPNIFISDDYTLLVIAIQEGDLAIIEALLKAGADPNKAVGEHHSLPLQYAFSHGSVVQPNCEGIIRLLIEYGANPNISVLLNHTPLHTAIDNGDARSVKALLAGHAEVNRFDDNGYTPLLMVAEYMTKEKQQLGQWDSYLDIAKQLLENGANPDVLCRADNCTMSPMMLAVQRENIDLIKLLLAKGANTEIQDGNGNTALYLAVYLGRRECAQILLEAGADPTFTDNKGINICDLAIAAHVVDNKGSSMRDLADAINPADPKSNMLALIDKHIAMWGSTIVTPLGIKTNADAIKPALDSALAIAISQGNQSLADDLLAAGADKSQAVMLAGACGHWEMVSRLLRWNSPSDNTTPAISNVGVGLFNHVEISPASTSNAPVSSRKDGDTLDWLLNSVTSGPPL